jgi:hypothetical protein
MAQVQDAALREAARRTRETLGTDAYLLVEGEDKHFLGEAALALIAGKVLGAFFRGLTASAEGRVEQWGREVGDWLADQAEALRDRLAGDDDTDPELAAAAAEAQAALAGADVTAHAAAAGAALSAGLRDHGLTAAAAARVAAIVQEAGAAAVTA